ncbi:MAG: DUF1194 domain-containing protein [Pseudomonadota bacterium]
MKWLLAFLLLPGPAMACALELILASDVSGSIDQREYRLQAGGLAEAFADERLLEAIELLDGGMLVTHSQWSGASRQRQVNDWHHLTDRASVLAFSAELSRTGRVWRNFSTAIGEALIHAAEVSATAPIACERKVIDVSGDGVSNEGRSPKPEAARLAAQGFTVNGLVIRGAAPDPVDHFENEVIAGPGAFVEIAQNFEDYPEAILRKLLREIDPPLVTSALPGR